MSERFQESQEYDFFARTHNDPFDYNVVCFVMLCESFDSAIQLECEDVFSFRRQSMCESFARSRIKNNSVHCEEPPLNFHINHGTNKIKTTCYNMLFEQT